MLQQQHIYQQRNSISTSKARVSRQHRVDIILCSKFHGTRKQMMHFWVKVRSPISVWVLLLYHRILSLPPRARGVKNGSVSYQVTAVRLTGLESYRQNSRASSVSLVATLLGLTVATGASVRRVSLVRIGLIWSRKLNWCIPVAREMDIGRRA